MGGSLTGMNRRTEKIEASLKSEHIVQSSIIKILLLGTGNSGKSTILKQFKLINNQQMIDEGARTEEKLSVSRNILTGISIIVSGAQVMRSHGVDLKFSLKNETLEAVKAIEAKRMKNVDADSSDLARKSSRELQIWDDLVVNGSSKKVHEWVQDMWRDECVQETFNDHLNHLSTLEVPMNYFMSESSWNRIIDSSYIPTNDDILNCRTRTTGLVAVDFVIDGFKCKIFDVGGQRNERKKWISHFDNVHAVIFIVSLADYCRRLLEDPSMNRLQEAVDVFRAIVESPFFERTNVVLFLNKKDLFEELIERKRDKLKDYFPEYDGPDEYEACLGFITSRFVNVFREVREMQGIERTESEIYDFQTMATNTQNVEVVFGFCKHILLMKNLSSIGMF